MPIVAAWLLVVLGVTHVIFGAVRFKTPLKEAFAEGFVGKFMGIESRRLAFWFTFAGPPMVMAGHIALRAVAIGHYELIHIVGYYLLGISLPGVLAFPKSPMWGGLLLAPFLIFAAA